MITPKEYEIYLKVKKFTETENCDENDIIPKIINGVGIIPSYCSINHSIGITWKQLNITPYRLLQGGVEF